jgi:hypothetical protein
MTIEEFLAWVGGRPLITTAVLASVPLATWIVGAFHRRERSGFAPWRQVYSSLLHATCVPGVFAAVIVAYTFLFTRGNLLGMNVVVTFLPIAAMIATIVIITRRVDLGRLPGFDRLSGLIGLMALSFVVALLLDRFRLLLIFGGGMLSLLVAAVIVYVAFRSAASAAFGRRRSDVQ